MRSCRGSTLIELLVVVVMIGILSAIAVPRFLAMTGETALEGAAQSLFQDLVWAKTLAQKNSGISNSADTLVRVVFDATSRTWSIQQKAVAPFSAPSASASAWRTLRVSDTLPPSVVFGFGSSGISVSGDLTGALPSAAIVGGIGNGLSGTPVCADGSGETWTDGVLFCGGRVANAETGSVFLTSTRSSHRAYCVLFNRSKSLVMQKFRFLGGSWTAL